MTMITLRSQPTDFQIFDVGEDIPAGSSIYVNWIRRSIRVMGESDAAYARSGTEKGNEKEKEKEKEEGDQAFIDPEPELPMGQTNILDATKDSKYVVMDSEGWSHAPNGSRFSNQQRVGNSPLIQLFKEVENLLVKETMPVCCFALANARGTPDISPHISGQLSSLFMRGVLRRKKYHCECRGCVNVSDGRTIFHYQLMPGIKK